MNRERIHPMNRQVNKWLIDGSELVRGTLSLKTTWNCPDLLDSSMPAQSKRRRRGSLRAMAWIAGWLGGLNEIREHRVTDKQRLLTQFQLRPAVFKQTQIRQFLKVGFPQVSVVKPGIAEEVIATNAVEPS